MIVTNMIQSVNFVSLILKNLIESAEKTKNELDKDKAAC